MWWSLPDLCPFRRSKTIIFHAFDAHWIVIGHLVISPLWAEELSEELSVGHLLEIARTCTLPTSKLSAQRISRLSPFSRCHAFLIERLAIWHTFIPSTVYGKGLSAQPFCPYSFRTRKPSCLWAKLYICPRIYPSCRSGIHINKCWFVHMHSRENILTPAGVVAWLQRSAIVTHASRLLCMSSFTSLQNSEQYKFAVCIQRRLNTCVGQECCPKALLLSLNRLEMSDNRYLEGLK
jgi:hypothetical protein